MKCTRAFAAGLSIAALALIGAATPVRAAVPAAPPAAPACDPARLRLALDGRDGDFNGMSHGGTEVSIRNLGPDCSLPALLPVALYDARGVKLPVQARTAPAPRPARLRLGGGHRAAMSLRWVSGPVYARNRSAHVAEVRVQVGAASLRAPLDAVMYGAAGAPIALDRTPLRAMEGMAADR
ncbi:DUF4232 domain-containing protein [Massilia forsythiae]|uniref:DUF4232 domain-containing protein n=1 Tax=Massilia forsythiae TaxID=2728020 RepID=A0A7Z2ZUJ0_9BURK|nr:DUF4232 domain-containing protein [Massilia forsythiae]QJE02608.1 DUF4232 domain-containing protein [Massilia forsythiae]